MNANSHVGGVSQTLPKVMSGELRWGVTGGWEERGNLLRVGVTKSPRS